MPLDPEIRAHKAWLGFLQPVGLVVSPPALVEAQAVLNRAVLPLQQTLATLVQEEESAPGQPPRVVVSDFPALTRALLGWEATDLIGDETSTPLPDSLELPLPHEILRPTFAVPDPDRAGHFLMLIQTLPTAMDLDDTRASDASTHHYHASPQLRFERLLQGVGVPLGLLFNGTHLRIVCAPARESSGHLTFPFQAMLEVAGRPILGAFHMLLEADRLFTMPRDRRLPAILSRSREFQNTVSTALADQVFEALSELLRGFQSADRLAEGCLFGDTMANEPDHIYGGLLTVMMRLLFLLYAEDKGLVPAHPVYARYYSVAGLFERLREDAGRYPDTMDLRFGAWASLLTLFRLIYQGGTHGELILPARKGELFDPSAYPFLEGRPRLDHSIPSTFEPPRVSDGALFRILERLLMLDGERLSYRALDVEHLGSVYEAMMGYALERTGGHSIALRPHHVVIDLETLLEQPAPQRDKWLKEQADCKLDGKALDALKKARTVADAVAALARKLSPRTPNPLSPGTLYLQPGEERRRSGSHYTPRKLTEPIVRTALRPVLERLLEGRQQTQGPELRPEQVLSLKVCDPAMGSGAFLVETCRQLGELLASAYERFGLPEGQSLPPDETLALFARRRVAESCLYGVDKNPFAVGLAKLSLWLETLAKDHPFTFVDHAFRCGDSLVGLSHEQLTHFHWQTGNYDDLPLFSTLSQQLGQAAASRQRIQSLGEEDGELKHTALLEARHSVEPLVLAGDLVVAAFFAGQKDKDRETHRKRFRMQLDEVKRAKGAGHPWLRELVEIQAGLRQGPRPVRPFHWPVEFPEVFERANPGFDCVVGNPPFAGKNTITHANREGFLDWLKWLHPGAHGNADLVAHFFRRAFAMLRNGGTLGLIATNTIAQGDTRSTGLRWLCEHGGNIYEARKRVKWPGLAAVVISVVHVVKGKYAGPALLNARSVHQITAFLFHAGGHADPHRLQYNQNKSFQGVILLGMGFTFDDTNPEASSIAEMHRLIDKDPRNAERIFPYIGGEEVNNSPTHAHHRHAINFGDMSEAEARQWPDLMAIVEEKVKPSRLALGGNPDAERRRTSWWKWGRYTPALFSAVAEIESVLTLNCGASPHLAIARISACQVFANTLAVITILQISGFTLLQSRIHEVWARFFGSSMKDDLRYTPSDCFETFPFPEGWEQNPVLEQVGERYYTFRAQVMIDHNEGLTDTYNRFHDPHEGDASIMTLRALHSDMDRAVLEAYGWSDLNTACGFGLEYLELDEDSTLPADVQARIDAGDLFFVDAASAQDFDAALKSATGSKRKLPWRLRWPEAIHDEVLARLLDLNQRQAEHERLGGEAASSSKKRTPEPQATPTPEKGMLGAGGAPTKPQKRAKTVEPLPLFPGLKKG